MPTGEKTFFSAPEQEGQVVRGASEKDWTTSWSSPQSVQRYSYVGI